MINEGVLRSPKWLRNFADFEINTGEDIKGEPSEKRKRQLEKERKIKEEERRIKEKEEREREREEERKRKEQEETNILVDELIKNAIYFINNYYKKCNVKVDAYNNEVTISHSNLKFDGKDLKFEITLENSVVIPKFRCSFTYNGYIYTSKLSGFNYTDFKIFILQVIYPFYSSGGYKSNSNSYEESSRKAREEETKRKANDTYEEYKKRYSSSNETEEVKKRRRLYNLLKETLDGYLRTMDRIKEWEKKNPGKKHTDRDSTEKEIEAVETKIKNIKDKYKFESLNHLTSFIFY